ncbi:hypothetical protein AAFN47_27470 [Hoeflea sp. CAU 1731]
MQISKIRVSAAQASAALLDLPDDPLKALARIKFDPIGWHPIEQRALNLIEQVNQTFTYLVALKAARLLLEWHPEAEGYRLAPGAHAPKQSLDIESLVPGVVGAETFAAVRPENNRKLIGDLTKLASRPERFRYVFFMSPLFPETQRRLEKERDGIGVWSISAD